MTMPRAALLAKCKGQADRGWTVRMGGRGGGEDLSGLTKQKPRHMSAKNSLIFLLSSKLGGSVLATFAILAEPIGSHSRRPL